MIGVERERGDYVRDRLRAQVLGGPRGRPGLRAERVELDQFEELLQGRHQPAALVGVDGLSSRRAARDARGVGDGPMPGGAPETAQQRPDRPGVFVRDWGLLLPSQGSSGDRRSMHDSGSAGWAARMSVFGSRPVAKSQ